VCQQKSPSLDGLFIVWFAAYCIIEHMSEKTPLIFTPGFRDTFSLDTGSYGRVLRVIQGAGFDPCFFQPDWRDSRPHIWAADMVNYANRVVDSRKRQSVVFAGFSCGALIAVLAAAKMEQEHPEVALEGLMPCSLSPWFGIERIKRAHQQPHSDLHGTSDEVNANLSKLKLPFLKCPTHLYVGTREIPTVRDMHVDALNAWPQARSIQPPTGHNIFDDSYLRALEENIPILGKG
jgi:hypothetical protein